MINKQDYNFTTLGIRTVLKEFLENIESEECVIKFIQKNHNSNFIQKLMYESGIDHSLVRAYNKVSLDKDTKRKFCTQFIAGCYKYIETIDTSVASRNEVM